MRCPSLARLLSRAAILPLVFAMFAPAHAITVLHESGDVVDVIWVMPQVDLPGGGLGYADYAIEIVGAPTGYLLEWTCDGSSLFEEIGECDLVPTSGFEVSLTQWVSNDAIWEIRTQVSPSDLPTDNPTDVGRIVVTDGLSILHTLPTRIPSIQQLKPTLDCAALDRPGFVKGQSVGKDIPVDQTFPQITYVTVKPCEVCDFSLNGYSPISVDVKFEYQGTQHDGEDCDPADDDACDPDDCATTDNGDVWRKDFDVQPYEEDSQQNPDPLTVFIEASNNINQTATGQVDMDLVVQFTSEQRDQNPSIPAMPLWAADPKQFLIDLAPGLEKLGEYVGLSHYMKIQEEINASLEIRASVDLPSEHDGNTDVGDGKPGVENDNGGGKSFEFNAEGGLLYVMTIQADPSSVDLKSNITIDGEAELNVTTAGREVILSCEMVGTGDSPSSSSLIDVLTQLKLTEIAGGCDLSVTLWGVVYKVKNKVMKRYIKEIAAAINGLFGASLVVVGNGTDVDSWDLDTLGIEPGIEGVLAFSAYLGVVEADVGVKGNVTVPIDYFPDNAPKRTECNGADWCVKIGATAEGEAKLVARAGPFELVDTKVSASGNTSLAVIKPDSTGISGDPGAPVIDAPPDPGTESFITATDAAVDSRNNLWFAFTAGNGTNLTQNPVTEAGTLVIWNCGTNHSCSSKTEKLLSGQPGQFAYSPAIAVDSSDNIIVAWAEAPINVQVQLDQGVLYTARYDRQTQIWSPAQEILTPGSTALRYGLAMETTPLTALFADRVSLTYVEDRDPTQRFACTDAEADCTTSLPISDIMLTQYDFNVSSNPINVNTLTLSNIGTYVRDNPDVAVDSTGRALVVWDEFVPFVRTERTPPDLYARVVSQTGTTMLGIKRLTSNFYVDTQPSVEFDALGNALIAWSVITEARNLGSGALNPAFLGAGGSTALGGPAAVVASKADGGSELDLWVYDDLQQEPEQRTTDPYDQRDPSVMDELVVYSSREDGGEHYDLWLMDLRSDTPIQLTDDAFDQREPAIHVGAGGPDAATIKVAYVSQEPGTGGEAISDNLWLLRFSLGTLPAVEKFPLSANDSAERDPTFDDSGDQLMFSTGSRISTAGEVPADGCNLWSLDIGNPLNPMRSPFTDAPGCDAEPAWLGDRVVYRCGYLDELVERTRPEPPCDMQFRALAAGGEGGYTFDWDIDGQNTQGTQVVWPFGNCSPQGKPVTHTIQLTTTDCADGSPGCVQSSYMAGMTVSTDGLRPPLRVDVDLSNGTILPPIAPLSAGQVVRFTGKIAGGEPPYQARFVFGDGATSAFEDVVGYTISLLGHTYYPLSSSSGPYLGRVEVQDSSGMTASRTFRIDVGPLREARAGVPGHPLKAVAMPVLPYHKRPRRGLCEASASDPPVLGGPVTRLLDGTLPGTEMTDARSPSLGPGDSVMFFMRPGGSPVGVGDELMLGDFALPGKSLGSIGPLPGLRPPNQPQPSELLQYGEYSLVRMAAFRMPPLVGGASLGVLSLPVDVNRPGLFARHPKVAPGPAGSFIVLWRGDHTGGQEPLRIGLDGDTFFSRGSVSLPVQVPGQFTAYQPTLSIDAVGLVAPGALTSWKGSVVAGTAGPTMIWVDKDKATPGSQDLLQFNTSQSWPGGGGSWQPPFGSGGQGAFELGNGEGTFCPIDPAYDGGAQGPTSLGIETTTGTDGSFQIPAPVFPEIPIGGAEAVQIDGQGPWNGEVGPQGEVVLTGLADLTLLVGGGPTEVIVGAIVAFTTGPVAVRTHPGGDLQFCTPDDRALLVDEEDFLLLGQYVDADGVAVTHALIPIPFAAHPSLELLAQMTLRFDSQALSVQRLLVSETGGNNVLGFVRETGESLGVYGDASFIPSGLGTPRGLGIGTGDDLFVADGATDRVLRYDGDTGAYEGVFVGPPNGGLTDPRGLLFGPDGHVYVASLDDSIKRYDGTTGAYLGDFVTPGDGGLDGEGHFVFGPDDNLYASDTVGHSIKRYDGTTGGYVDEFVMPGGGGLDSPRGLAFGPGGNLYVAGTSGILRFVGDTGEPMGLFGEADDAGSGLMDPDGLVFGPTGDLFVTSPTTRDVKRYKSGSGEFLGVFGDANDLESPTFMAFIRARDADLDGLPDDVDTCLGVTDPDNTDTDGDGLGDVCDLCPLDAQNDVDIDGYCADVDNCPDIYNPGQGDTDMDTVGDACDVCPNVPNPDQQALVFESIFSNGDQLLWAAPVDARYAAGPLEHVPLYTTYYTGVLLGTTLDIAGDAPAPGTGFYYLLRLEECGTWASAPGAEPDRDAVLP